MLVLLIEGIYEVTVEMGSGTMMHKPSLIRIGSGIKKLLGEYIYGHTDSTSISSILLIFSKYEK
jgi:hypothetical protein